jgi:murein DD-endopeptidase MepM/ murein hydrolase activator NlpD
MGRNRAAGNFIVISHKNGLESYYNHLQTHQSGLRAGDAIKTGQKIGANGCTGYCTKPHLHFALKKQGRFIDPIRLVRSYPFHRRGFIYKQLASK